MILHSLSTPGMSGNNNNPGDMNSSSANMGVGPGTPIDTVRFLSWFFQRQELTDLICRSFPESVFISIFNFGLLIFFLIHTFFRALTDVLS